LIELKLRIKELEAITLKESRQESRAESSQFQDHLLKKDQFVDDLFNLHHLPDQPGPVKPLTEEPVCRTSHRGSCSLFVCVRTEPEFFKVSVHVREQVTKF
jgi:hypothetical protein